MKHGTRHRVSNGLTEYSFNNRMAAGLMDISIFYWMNYAGAIVLTLAVFFRGQRKQQGRDPNIISVFLLGSLLGAFWEFPFNAWAAYDSHSIVVYLNEPPLAWWLCAGFHSLWDGGIFLAGWFLVRVFRQEAFQRFSWWDLGILLAWGQIQEFGVEMLSLSMGAWEWRSTWWSPVIVEVGGMELTLLPQMIWLLAPIVFYFVLLFRSHARKTEFTANSLKRSAL